MSTTQQIISDAQRAIASQIASLQLTSDQLDRSFDEAVNDLAHNIYRLKKEFETAEQKGITPAGQAEEEIEYPLLNT